MILNFEGKKNLESLMNDIDDIGLLTNAGPLEDQVYQGDNLEVMKSMLMHYDMRGKIDLMYIDPPYASDNVFSTSDTRKNTISRAKGGEVAYEDVLKGDDYLAFIQHRLLLMKELLSDTGSVYVHIDNSMGHYVKVIMDEIFGMSNFLNDLSRIKCNPKNFPQKSFGNVKDIILYYSSSGEHTWNDLKVPKTAAQIEKGYKKINDKGQRYTTVPLHAPGETQNGPTGQPWRGVLPPEGRHWRTEPALLEKLDEEGLIEWSKNGNPRKIKFAKDDEGSRIQDILEYKDPQKPSYPTEKNNLLLSILIQCSSNPGDIVMDCFCGSGGTLNEASKLDRKFIGIDQSPMAIEVTTKRLGLNSNSSSD